MIDLLVIWIYENIILRIPGVAPTIDYITGDVHHFLEENIRLDHDGLINLYPMFFTIAVVVVIPAIFYFKVSPKINGLTVPCSMTLLYMEIAIRLDSWTTGKKASYIGQHKPPHLSLEQQKAKMRGVQVVSRENYTANKQSMPPTKKVYTLYPPGHMPKGEVLENPPVEKSWFGPPSVEENPAAEEGEAYELRLKGLREGAEVLREARQHMQHIIRPGMDVMDIINIAEHTVGNLLGVDRRRKRSLLCPAGLALNEVALNWTPTTFDNRRWLLPTDLATLDLGVQVDGHDIDTAFSFSFDPMHDELLQVVREATNTGVRLAGVDACVDDLGAQVAEVLNAGQVHMPNGKVLPVRTIRNLTGSMGGVNLLDRCGVRKCIPIFSGQYSRQRMKPGELWVVDAFGSVDGCGYTRAIGENRYHVRPGEYAEWLPEHHMCSEEVKDMARFVDRNHGSNLVLCQRWVCEDAAREKIKKDEKDWWEEQLQSLYTYSFTLRGDVMAELPGSHVARFSHTVLIGSKEKEVLTRGLDF